MNATRHTFTLAELLTAIVLIAIIVGATVPAYNRLMTGNAVSYGARTIASQLNMARTHACLKRRPVAVLFPDYALSYTSPENAEAMAQKSFRAAYVKQNGVDWEFDSWVEGTKWEYLPVGAFFPHYKTGASLDKFANHDGEENKDPTHRGNGLKSIQTTSMPYYSVKDVEDDSTTKLFTKGDFLFAIIYDKDGKPTLTDQGGKQGASAGGEAPCVQIRQGAIVDISRSNGIKVVKAVNADGSATDNFMTVKTNRYTGAVRTRVADINEDDEPGM